MPYITSIILRTDSKELPRWLRKNYDAAGNFYYLNAWDNDEILNADVRRELKIDINNPEEVIYLYHDELLKFADVYDRYLKCKSIFNPQYWELRRAALEMRKLYVWLEATRPKYSLAWAEFYYSFDTKED
jgi:hypothetical protein